MNGARDRKGESMKDRGFVTMAINAFLIIGGSVLLICSLIQAWGGDYPAANYSLLTAMFAFWVAGK
jgi:hypothetical protein